MYYISIYIGLGKIEIPFGGFLVIGSIAACLLAYLLKCE